MSERTTYEIILRGRPSARLLRRAAGSPHVGEPPHRLHHIDHHTEVTAVASTRNIDLVRSLGAHHVIDYVTEDFVASERRYDLIIDIGGRNSVSRLRSVLDPTGTLVIVGGEDGNKTTGGIGRQLWALTLSPFISQRLTTFVSKEHFSFVERLADHIESGAVTPAVQATFDLSEAADAIDLLDTGKASGKNVIVIAPTH